MFLTDLRARLLAALWTLWAVLLLERYFRQVWRLLSAGPAVWVPFLRMVVDSLLPVAALAALSGAAVFAGSRFLRRSGRARPVLLLLPTAAAVGLLIVLLAPERTPVGQALSAGAAAAGLTAFPQAAARAAGGFVGAGAVLLAAQVPGTAVIRLLRATPSTWAELILYRTATGLGALAYLVFGLAGLHLYTAAYLRILVGALLVTGAVWLALRGEQRGPRVASSRTSPLDRAGRGDAIWKAVTLVALVIALIGALAPEREYDALWYHLGFPRLWLERGYLTDQPQEYVALYPMTWELLYGAALSLGGPIAAKLLHFTMLPLLGLLIFHTARRVLPRTSPWAAVAFFVTIPTVLWEATTAYVDLGLTLYAGLAGFALFRYAAGARARSWLLLAAVQLGLALATKHLGGLILVVATAGLFLFLCRRDGLRRVVGPVALLVAVALLIALPWYLRSWLATGNPVFPELYGLFGAPPDRWDAAADAALNRFEAYFGRARTPLYLLTLPWDVTVHAARYGGALGPLFLLLLPVLLLARRPRTLPLVLIVLAYGALWASPLSNFQLRFLLPVTPLLALMAAAGLGRLAALLRAGRLSWARPVVTGSVAALLFLNLPPFIPLHEADRVGWEGWLTHVTRRVPIGVVLGVRSEENYLGLAVPSYRAWRYINSHLPADARILTFSGGDNFYSRRDRLWVNALQARVAVWGSPAGAERRALQALADLKISHVLVDKTELATLSAASVAIAEPSFRRRWLALQYEDGRFALYRIRWEEVAHAGP